MNNIQHTTNAFAFLGDEVRTAIDDKGEPLFCAKDVFEALGIAWAGASGSLRNYPGNRFCLLYLQGQSGSGEVIFLTEAGLYQTLFRSQKPKAEAFAAWVFEEVLPSLRRQGFYGRLPYAERLATSRHLSKLLQQLTGCRDSFAMELLKTEIGQLANLIGIRLPDFRLLGKDAKQAALPLEGEGA